MNPTADDLELELDRFRRKVAAGARFAMTQALFELDSLERFGDLLGGWPIPVLLGVWPLRSHAMALRLHNEVPGISVPEALLDELDKRRRRCTRGRARAREGARRGGAGPRRRDLRDPARSSSPKRRSSSSPDRLSSRDVRVARAAARNRTGTGRAKHVAHEAVRDGIAVVGAAPAGEDRRGNVVRSRRRAARRRSRLRPRP